MNYIPLQVQSGYTFLESSLKVEDIVNVSIENRIPFACCSEIGNMYSFPLLNTLCKKNNLKPIFGVGLNIKINSFELLVYLYIKNEDGYSSLCNLISKDKNLENLNKYSSGLILVIPTLSNNFDSIDNLSRLIFEVSKNFEDVYLGIEYYQKSDKEAVNKYREFAKKYNYKTICFPKHLYLTKHDALNLKIVQAIKNEEKIVSKNELDGPFYFLGEHAINALYTEEERKNTYLLANSISFEFNKKRGKLLNFSYNSNLPVAKFLEFMCLQSAKKRQIELNEQYLERLKFEIETIDKMGYCSYFLIVQDYVDYAKTHNIPVGPGRGSAAGSLVSYLLGITEIDPLKYNLMFERFLNPHRLTMPDIDIDIADYARSEVIDYINKKYGQNRMANIITFQTIGAKQSLRDIGRIFSINNADINNLCSLIKQPNISLDEAIRTNKDLASLYSDSYFYKIITLAKKIEGLPRQESLHAAGIILNEEDLTSVIPTKIGQDGKLVTQFESIYLEDLGFLKMDLLGLRNLTLISYCENQIRKHNPSFYLSKISLCDQKTFDVLNAGLTQGIFQLESEGITSALKKIKIQSFDDLVALLALYRPGPMDNINIYASRKNENQKVEYIHPLVEEILKPTYGVIIYQEQIMEIVQKISNFSLAQADLFRRAISKKDVSKFNDLKKQFIDGALSNNIPLNIAENIFSLIDKFANYGFNKSHSVSYALISYQMAYLKAHFPSIFIGTMLTFLSNSNEKYSKFNNDFNVFQIKLDLPNINYSLLDYQERNSKLILPLTAIKGLPFNLSQSIIHERNTKGLFSSLDEIIARLLPYGFNINHFNTLINSGALDGFSYNRASMRKALPILIQFAETTINEMSLLSTEEQNKLKPIIKNIPEDKKLNLEEEINTLGIMISGSIFDDYSSYIAKNNIKNIYNVYKSKATVKIGIFVTKVKEILTKSNSKMVIINGFDQTQDIEAILFNNQYDEFAHLIKEEEYLALTGYFRNDENYGLSFVINKVEKMEANK